MNTKLLLTLGFLSAWTSAPVDAATVTLSFIERDVGVFGTVSGSVDTDDLIRGVPALATPGVTILPALGLINITGPSATSLDVYNGFGAGPSVPFGTPGTVVTATSNTGDSFAFSNPFGTVDIRLDQGYTSLNPIQAAFQFDGATLADLGLSVGTTNISFTGDNTLQIVASVEAVTPVPLPASVLMLLMGVGAIRAMGSARKA
ncbi:hypothetical protein [Roseobacter cerasinus]|nr:hypothetical protein [Roseobacter cerasinus]